MSETYVGLDVGSSTCKLSAMDKDGRLIAERTFSTSEQHLIKAFAEIPGEVHVRLSGFRGLLRNGPFGDCVAVKSRLGRYRPEMAILLAVGSQNSAGPLPALYIVGSLIVEKWPVLGL